MRFHGQQAFRAVILLLFVFFIYKLHITNDILKLINPKYSALSITGVVILLLLFIAQLPRIWALKEEEYDHHGDHHRHHHHHDHGDGRLNGKKILSYVIIILPVATGLLIPPQTLDASIAAKKGAMLSLRNDALKAEQQKEEITDDDEQQNEAEKDNPKPTVPNERSTPSDDNPQDPNVDSNTVTREEYDQIIQNLEQSSSIKMSESLYSTYYQAINTDMEKYEGREITLNGFVCKEDGFASNQLVIGRFIITHCVADSSVIGFLSEFEDAASLPPDKWIEATGTIKIEEYNGVKMPIVDVTEWKEVERLEQPYLYPLSIQIM
ncbi:TIGR03943 family protein [Radiobacillus kanasensis]|uniref:TIGR03943 family putative permease subunit n=1 Tax=Radiobacillus kanasensis TaxID=2844358 RepID=UPI001E492EB2|nr:TIGR03943 family protein [Radiobacillus kanasensis]UFT98375.1 TIGR03943 family protein [Radiobacillus kanasensis]